MVQPHDKFVDHSSNARADWQTKVYRSVWGMSFLVPAESDILINFKPIRNSVIDGEQRPQSPTGKVRMRTWYQNSFNGTNGISAGQ